MSKNYYRWEIDEAVNGFRINMAAGDMWPVYKQNTETKLEALREVERSVKLAIRNAEHELEGTHEA